MKAKPLDQRLPGRYSKMTARQLDAEVAKYDAPFVAMREARPLTAAERRRDDAKLRRAAGRSDRVQSSKSEISRSDNGAARVSIRIEKSLLDRLDSYAKRRGLSRSEFISRSLREMLESAALTAAVHLLPPAMTNNKDRIGLPRSAQTPPRARRISCGTNGMIINSLFSDC